MLYRKLDKTGDELSILGYGCMRLPSKAGRIDEKRARAQIRSAIDQGVNYVDTAMPYHMGASETFLGRTLKDGYREKVRVATKMTSLFVKASEDMERVFNVQCNNLDIDYIDYYLLHGIDAKSWNLFKEIGALDFLEKLKAEGRIGATGFSFHGDKDVFKEIIDAYDWAMCQIQYNFLDRNIQAGTEGLQYAAARNIGVFIMEPLRGGNLTKKVPTQIQAIWDEADVKRSPAEWALRWLWNHPEIKVVLSGMNQEDHIEENLRIASDAHPSQLTEKELALIDRASDEYKGLTRAACTGCRYCMPCPSGVDIPSCFEIYNDRFMFDDPYTPKVFYLFRLGDAMKTGKPAFASECTECGKCVEACPQDLPIPDLLKDVADEFEGRLMRAIGWILSKLMAFQRRSILKKAKRVNTDN